MTGDTLPALLTRDDLAPFAVIDPAKADEMIADAVSQAVIVAPCLGDAATLTVVQATAVKAILRAAVLRWDEGGAGVAQTQAAGPFSLTLDTTKARRGVFWPSEITALQAVCRAKPRPYALDMGAAGGSGHLPWCDVMFGNQRCSCGASIAGQPIYEQG